MNLKYLAPYSIAKAEISLSGMVLCYENVQAVRGLVNSAGKLLTNNVPSWQGILVGNYFEKI
jgi:hypothetical protein